MDERGTMIINPSSFKRISIALHTEPAFFEQMFSYFPLLNVKVSGEKNVTAIPQGAVKVSSAFLDLFNDTVMDALAETAGNSDNFYRGSVLDLKIDKINLFNPVNTFTYSNFYSSYVNNAVQTKGGISLPILLPYNESNFNSYFQILLWKLSVFPFVPFFIQSDVQPQNIGGPLFCSKFTIDANESSYTKIDIAFVGGSKVSTLETYEDNLSNIQSGVTSGFGGTGTFTNNLGLYIFPPSRTARIFDCVLILGMQSDLYTDINLFQQFFVAQGLNIISMRLEINNEIKTFFTANDGVNKALVDGMKYIALEKRNVTGSFTFVASENLSEYFEAETNKQFILYFGGPFYYPMKNVTVQVFDLQVDANSGSFIHTVDFYALLQTGPRSEIIASIDDDVVYSLLDQESVPFYKQNQFDIDFEVLTQELYIGIGTASQYYG